MAEWLVLPSGMRGAPSSIPTVFKNLILRNQEFRTINCLSFGIELNFFEFKFFFDAHASTSTCYFLPCFFHLSYARGEYSCTSVITPFVCTHLSSLLSSFRQKFNLNNEITRKKKWFLLFSLSSHCQFSSLLRSPIRSLPFEDITSDN